jgi:hypothetical protein
LCRAILSGFRQPVLTTLAFCSNTLAFVAFSTVSALKAAALALAAEGLEALPSSKK